MISYLKRFFRNLGLTFMFIISGASVVFIVYYLASYMVDTYGGGISCGAAAVFVVVIVVAFCSIDDGTRAKESPCACDW